MSTSKTSSGNKVPSDKVSQLRAITYLHSCIVLLFQLNLRMIIVSGKTHEFLFSLADSAADITQHVYENWPEGT